MSHYHIDRDIVHGRELPGYPFDTRAFLTRSIIVVQRIVYSRWLRSFSNHAPLDHNWKGQAANDAIRNLLQGDAPCMIARFGSGEMETTLRHLDIAMPGHAPKKLFHLIAGHIGPFWWDNSVRAGITWIAGLFPPTNETMARFGSRVLDDCREIDLLAGWLAGEKRLHALYFPHAKCIPLIDLEPFVVGNPWTVALEGKTILIIHPFEASIRYQYAKRNLLFKNPRILPTFTLKTYKTVQSLAGKVTRFPTWFDALDHMCQEILRNPV